MDFHILKQQGLSIRKLLLSAVSAAMLCGAPFGVPHRQLANAIATKAFNFSPMRRRSRHG